MNIILEGVINSDMFKELANAYNNLEHGETLHIFLSSEGGHVDCAGAMTTLVNRYVQVTTITTYFRLESCAFDFFFKSKCYREILDSTMGMIHLKTWGGDIKEGLKQEARTEFIKNEMKKSLPHSVSFFKTLGVTDAEIRKFKEGEEVYFNSERLKKMLKRAY